MAHPIPLLAQSPAALARLADVDVLYTDLDGTLLALGGILLADATGAPSLATAEAIVRVNSAGLPVVLVTGRNRIQCHEITRMVGWRGFIAELGCVIVTEPGTPPIYFTGEWPEGTLAERETPFDRIVRAGAVEALQHAFPGKLESHAPHHHNREATILLRGNVDLDAAREVLGKLDVEVAIVDNGVIHPPSTGLAGVAEVHAYHLMPPGVSKATAVAADLARRGLAPEGAAAIGDSTADVAMGTAVGMTALVGNALKDARVVAAAQGRDDVFALTRERGEGWAEFADAWLPARERS